MTTTHSAGALTLMALMLANEEAETRFIIDQQIQAGVAPTTAVRPLREAELRAQVRFGVLENDRDAAVIEAEQLLSELHETIKNEFLTRMFGDADVDLTPEQAMSVIHELSTHQPQEISAAETSIMPVLAGIFAASYLLGGRRAIEEAGEQGVPVENVTPVARDVTDFLPQAQAVAAHPWRRIAGKLEETYGTIPGTAVSTISREDVAGTLDNIVVDGSRDMARQAINQAAGSGRNDTVDSSNALQPVTVWASEIMDGNACDSCQLIDGNQYRTMEAARVDYPDGQYRLCSGGARCRGVLVWLYS